jgi:hypothetical protein
VRYRPGSAEARETRAAVPVGPFRDRQVRVGPLGKAVELGADMGFQNLLHQRRLHLAPVPQRRGQLRRHQRGGPRGPGDPGIALLARQPEHQRLGPRPVDQLALQLLEPDAPLLRLQHLVRGLGLQEGRAAADRGRARPCSRSVSPTAATAASGTGFSFGAGGLRVFDGSVVSARARRWRPRRWSRRGTAPAARPPSPSGSRRATARHARRTGARSCPAFRYIFNHACLAAAWVRTEPCL